MSIPSIHFKGAFLLVASHAFAPRTNSITLGKVPYSALCDVLVQKYLTNFLKKIALKLK